MNYNDIVYYNGKSSASHKAELSLLKDGISINYIENNHLLSCKWYAEHIHKPEMSTGNILTLRYGEQFPYPSIEIKDKELAKKILQNYNLDTKSKKYSLFLENGIKGIALGAIIFVSIFLLFYKIILPNLAEAAAAAVPISYEEKIGKSFKNSLIADQEVDSVKSKALTDFYNTLNFKSPYNLDFTVVKSPIQNAYATPGGNIVIYSKIIEEMECPEELAALIGHELTHVNERHSTKAIFRSLANYMALSILLNDANGITAVLIDNANTISQLTFSRELEQEADEKALEYMYENNINPNGMVSLMEQLDKLSNGTEIPEFLSTHPVTKNRISFSKNYINTKNTATNYHTPNWHGSWETLKKPSKYDITLEEKIIKIFEWPKKKNDSL